MTSLRWKTGFLAIALLAFVTSDVMAQRGGGGRGQGGPGGGGRGGQGGPGGGFRGGQGGPGGGGFSRRGGGGDTTLGLLSIDAVKEEIELMPDQEDALKKFQEKREADREAQRSERPQFDFRNASEKEREEFFAKRTKEREEENKKVEEQLEEILFPEQMDRLKQIAIQLQGLRALANSKVQEELKVTEKQKEELTGVFDGARDKMRSAMQGLFSNRGDSGGDDGGSREDRFAKMRETMEKVGKEIEGEALDVLTSEQRKKFDEMKGEKFEMPEGQRGFGFGGRGGAGGGAFGGRGGPGGGRGGPGGGFGGRGGRGGGDGGRGGRGGGRPETEE